MKLLTRFDERVDSLAFVPTMGALHAGHLALIKKAQTLGANVLVSIYVNPTQFESFDDLARYPKTLDRDLELAEQAGANFVWTPTVDEIYPEGIAQVAMIPAGPIGDRYEGVARPNHFSGVLTVINRLFTITEPQFAIFGEKDYQQLFLIRRFANEKFPAIDIVAGATVRDSHGIALSSRNSRLSPQEMVIARVFPQAAELAKEIHSVSTLKMRIEQLFASQSGFTPDYVEVVDPDSLLPAPDDFHGVVRVLMAGWIGSVRLIDNFSHLVKGR